MVGLHPKAVPVIKPGYLKMESANVLADDVQAVQSLVPAGQSQLKPCSVFDLGQMGYEESLDLQRLILERRKNNEIPDCLIFVDYPHLITVGRSGSLEHLLVSQSVLEQRGVGLFFADRGGDITYHGPGQLVAYPVIDLKAWRRDVGLYLRTLEDCVVATLADFGIQARRVPGMTGTWVGVKKIASIGIRTSQWVTSHGLALNVNSDLSFFNFIVPCGLKSRSVTSMVEILGQAVDLESVKARFCLHFSRAFERTLEPVSSC